MNDIRQLEATKLPERVVFIHIPKTGGTSVHDIISRMFLKTEIHPERLNFYDRVEEDTLHDYRLFSAHMDARTLPLIPSPKYVMTVLREPKERILSLYYFWRSHTWEYIEKNQLNGPRIAKSLDLLSFLKKRDEAIPVNIENTQTRAIWGHLLLFKEGEPFEVDTVKLNHAIKALQQYDLIGLMEKLPETMSRVYDDFGVLNPPQLPKLQVGNPVDQEGHENMPDHREHIEREPISDEINHYLDLLTVYDRPIYEHAQKLFVGTE